MTGGAATRVLARHGLALAALASLVAGYADLWRGGTGGALLLVLGYCVLVPLALLGAGRPAPRLRRERAGPGAAWRRSA